MGSHLPIAQFSPIPSQPASLAAIIISPPASMSSPWIFLCPSSRGIGHALTRRLLLTTSLPILATSRRDTSSTKSSLLADLPNATDLAPRLSIVNLDVTDESSVQAAARARELFPAKTHHLGLA